MKAKIASAWKGTSEKKFKEAEDRMFYYFDVPQDYIHAENIYIGD